MISLKTALVIHQRATEAFGGLDGIRDMGLLEAAIERPFMMFDGQELYPKTSDKAAAILESVVKNHPFMDGNKRTGYILMRLILLKNKLDVQAIEDEKYELVIKVAEGVWDFDKIKKWIEERLTKH